MEGRHVLDADTEMSHSFVNCVRECVVVEGKQVYVADTRMQLVKSFFVSGGVCSTLGD